MRTKDRSSGSNPRSVYDPRVTEEEDIQWLRELDDDLWPPGHKSDGITLKGYRLITQEELKRVIRCIEEYRLVTEMHCTSMFGGYGIKVYDNPAAPGVPLVPVLFLIEDHLPIDTRWSLVDEEPSVKRQGCGRDDAWELFSRYTHTDQNKEWTKTFRLKPSRERSHYDY